MSTATSPRIRQPRKGAAVKYCVICWDHQTKATTEERAQADLVRIEQFGACSLDHWVVDAGLVANRGRATLLQELGA